MYPLAPAFQRAFDASGTLVEEIDLAQADSLSPADADVEGDVPDGRRSTRRCRARPPRSSPPGWRRCQASRAAEPMKPWVVTLMLTAIQMQTSGLDATLGLDKHFYDKAIAAGRPVVGLETAGVGRSIASTRCQTPCRSRCCASTLKDHGCRGRRAEGRPRRVEARRHGVNRAELLGGFRAYREPTRR